MDFDLVKVLKESDQQPIDIALNSYYSFIFLKKIRFMKLLDH